MSLVTFFSSKIHLPVACKTFLLLPSLSGRTTPPPESVDRKKTFGKYQHPEMKHPIRKRRNAIKGFLRSFYSIEFKTFPRLFSQIQDELAMIIVTCIQ